MAYPEPTPILRGRHAKESLERLEEFKLTPWQRQFYGDARESYRKLMPRAVSAVVSQIF
jgi:hypothetical protein